MILLIIKLINIITHNYKQYDDQSNYLVFFQVTRMSLISSLNKMPPEVELFKLFTYMASHIPLCFCVLAIHIVSAL